MPATFKAVIKSEPRADGTHAIRIRVTHNRVVRFYATGLFIPATFWNKDGKEHLANWIKTRYRDHKKVNDAILEALNALADIAQKNKAFTSDEIINAYKAKEAPEQDKGFIAFCRVWIARKHSLKQAGTGVLYGQALQVFLTYAGEAPDESKLLSSKGGAAFLSWLLNAKKPASEGEEPKPRYQTSTVKLMVGLLNTMYDKALAEGWIPSRANPFDNSTVIVQRKKKQRPTKEQVLSMLNLNLKPNAAHARNAFLLQFFINGARIFEALTLRWSDVKETHIEYYPKKRSAKLKIVKRNPGIDWVLSQYTPGPGYILPYLTPEDQKLPPKAYLSKKHVKVAQINYHLQNIGKLLGLPFRLSSHMSRHAFTDALLKQTNDLRKVQAMVGHASLQSTENYVKDLSQEDLDQTADNMFSDFSNYLGQHEDNNFNGSTGNDTQEKKAKRGRKG